MSLGSYVKFLVRFGPDSVRIDRGAATIYCHSVRMVFEVDEENRCLGLLAEVASPMKKETFFDNEENPAHELSLEEAEKIANDIFPDPEELHAVVVPVWEVHFNGRRVSSMHERGIARTGRGKKGTQKTFPDSLHRNRFMSETEARKAAQEFETYANIKLKDPNKNK